MNLPLGAVALRLLKDAIHFDRSDPDHRVDLWGATHATLGLGLLAAGLTATEGGWPLTPVWAAVVAGFVAVEARVAHPTMPLRHLEDRGFTAANLATFALYAALSAVLFFLSYSS